MLPDLYRRYSFILLTMTCVVATILSDATVQAQIPGTWKQCDLSKSIQVKDFRIDSTRYGYEAARIFIGSNHTKYVRSAGNGEFYVLRRIRVDSSFVDRPWNDTIRVQRRAYYVLQHLLNYGDSVETIRQWLVDSTFSSLILLLDGKKQPVIVFGRENDRQEYFYDRFLRFDTKTRTWNNDFGGGLPPFYTNISPFWSGTDSCITMGGNGTQYISSDGGTTFIPTTLPNLTWERVPKESDSVFYEGASRITRKGFKYITVKPRGRGYCSWPDLGIYYDGGGVTDAVWNVWRFFSDTVSTEIALDASIYSWQTASDGVGFTVSFRRDVRDMFEVYGTVDIGRHWTRLQEPWIDPAAIRCEFDRSRREPCVLVSSIDSGVVSVAEYIPAEVPVQTIRWPIDGASGINTAVRFICPVRPDEEVEVSVSYLDTTETFSMRGPTTLRTYRDAYTTYRWRYRVRQDQDWSPWSTSWTFSTGSLRYWDPIAERRMVTSVHGGMLVGSKGSQGIQVSYDDGETWNEVEALREDKIQTLFPLLDGSVIILDEKGNHSILSANGRDVLKRDRQRRKLFYLFQTLDGTIYSNSNPFKRSRDGGRTWDTIPIHGAPNPADLEVLPNGNIIVPMYWSVQGQDGDTITAVEYDPVREEIIYPSARTIVPSLEGYNSAAFDMTSVCALSDSYWISLMWVPGWIQMGRYQTHDGGRSWQFVDTQYVDNNMRPYRESQWLGIEHLQDGRPVGYINVLPYLVEYAGDLQWQGIGDGLSWDLTTATHDRIYGRHNQFVRSIDGTLYFSAGNYSYRLIDIGDPYPSYRRLVKNVPVTMEWKPYRGADRYRLRVYRSIPGSSRNELVADTIVTENRYSMDGIPDYTGRLYWNVTPSVNDTWLAPYSPRVIDVRDSIATGIPERDQDQRRPLQIVGDRLPLSTARLGSVDITIHDLTGAVIAMITLDVLDGRLAIPTAGLPRGLYHVIIRGTGTQTAPERAVFFKE